jgi:2-C-methyl-D-erythritol 4-phosphate cytidylyltransferase
MPDLAAIVPAAGSSTRYGRNKLLEELEGETVLQRALLALWNHEFITEIFVATSDDAIAEVVRKLPARPSKDIHICPGGLTRAHSVLSALRQVPPKYEWIAVHDAARPRGVL